MSSHGTPVAASVSHQHIAAVINTLLRKYRADSPIRVLDFGCGNGRLITYLHEALPALSGELTFEVYGLDVTDAGQQRAGYMVETIRMLEDRHGDVDWRERVSLVTTRDGWPFADRTFDFIVSNAVIEHVANPEFVFSEIRRCLAVDGVGVNLFPLRNVVWEGHAHMPFVHRIRDVHNREAAMRLLGKVGFKKHYHRSMPDDGNLTLEQFAHDFARVLETDTNYQSARQVVARSESVGLNVSFDYTKDFFIAKARAYVGRPAYTYHKLSALDGLGFALGKYIADVTVLMRRSDASPLQTTGRRNV
jgi:SAM-dependent methyltransferase